MNQGFRIMIMIGIAISMSMPMVGAITTDHIYVGDTGMIAGYPTYDYDAQRWGDYIVWTRALDIYDGSGNVNPNGVVTDRFDPSWIMIHQISTGESWNLTEDYYAGLRVSPNQYYHSDSVSIYNNKIVFQYQYGSAIGQSILYMYNITQDQMWALPLGTLSTFVAGFEHQIYGDWIYFTHWGSGNRYIYVYNYKTNAGRRIDGGATQNTNLGMNDEFMWFTDTSPTPDKLRIYSLTTGKLTLIDGTNTGTNIYASNKSINGYLGIMTLVGTNRDSHVIDMVGMNISSVGGDETIYWEDINSTYVIPIDTDISYNSYPPISDGNYAIFGVRFTTQFDIHIYDIKNERLTYLASSSNDEQLTDYSGSMILFHSNINSFTKNNNPRDDYDIYRTLSDTEYIGVSITNYIPYIIIFLVIGSILGAFALFGMSASGGMI